MYSVELIVPGRYWHHVQPFNRRIVILAEPVIGDDDLTSLGSYEIESAEQDDAPHGPVRVIAHRREPGAVG